VRTPIRAYWEDICGPNRFMADMKEALAGVARAAHLEGSSHAKFALLRKLKRIPFIMKHNLHA
jgi:ferredoxin-NADP reductase